MKDINEWIYTLLDNMELEGLREFEKRLKQGSLIDILDRQAFRIISLMSAEKLVRLEKAFPGIIEKVPFYLALICGNTYILSRNKECYLKENWENTFASYLFLNNNRTRDIEALLETGEGIRKTINLFEWIKENYGRLPKVNGLAELCTKGERVLFFAEPDTKTESKKQLLKMLQKLRELSGEKQMELGNIGDYLKEEIGAMPYENYEKVVVSIRNTPELLIELLKHCPIEKIQIKNEEQLLDCDFCDELLNLAAFEDEIQKMLCELYEKYYGIEKLYSLLNDGYSVGAAYKTIILCYFRSPGERDAKIGERMNEEKKEEKTK